MKILTAFEIEGSKVRIRLRSGNINKVIWFVYPQEEVFPPEYLFPLAIAVAIPLICMTSDREVELEVRGIPCWNDATFPIFSAILREKYAAFWDTYKKLKGLPFEFPQVSIKGEGRWNPSKVPSSEIVGLNFSFGKESNLVRALAVSMFPKWKHVYYFVEGSTYNKLAYRDLYSKYPDLRVVRTNVNHLSGILGKEFPDLYDTRAYYKNFGGGPEVVFGFDNRVPIPFFLIALPMVLRSRIRYWMMGNEVDCTRKVVLENGNFHYQLQLAEESLYYEQIYASLMAKFLEPSSFFSPISSLSERKVLDILLSEFPEFSEDVRGCWHSGSKTVWCGECYKCRFYTISYLSMGRVPPFRMSRKMSDFVAPPSYYDYDENSNMIAVDRTQNIPDPWAAYLISLFLKHGKPFNIEGIAETAWCHPWSAPVPSHHGPDLITYEAL